MKGIDQSVYIAAEKPLASPLLNRRASPVLATQLFSENTSAPLSLFRNRWIRSSTFDLNSAIGFTLLLNFLSMISSRISTSHLKQ